MCSSFIRRRRLACGTDAETSATRILEPDLGTYGAFVAKESESHGERLQIVVSLSRMTFAEDDPVLVGVLVT